MFYKNSKITLVRKSCFTNPLFGRARENILEKREPRVTCRCQMLNSLRARVYLHNASGHMCAHLSAIWPCHLFLLTKLFAFFDADACFFHFYADSMGVEICHDGVWIVKTIVCWCYSEREREVHLQVSHLNLLHVTFCRSSFPQSSTSSVLNCENYCL